MGRILTDWYFLYNREHRIWNTIIMHQWTLSIWFDCWWWKSLLLRLNTGMGIRKMSNMGSATGGPGGHGPPPQIFLGGGASNAFGPPQILGKILLCTQLMYSVFLWKKQWNAYIIVYILLKFSKTSKFFLKTFKIVIKFSKFLQFFLKTH